MLVSNLTYWVIARWHTLHGQTTLSTACDQHHNLEDQTLAEWLTCSRTMIYSGLGHCRNVQECQESLPMITTLGEYVQWPTDGSRERKLASHMKKKTSWIQPDPPYWSMSGFWLLWPGPTQCSSHHALPRKGFWDQRGVAPEQTLRPRVPVVKRHKHAHLDTDRNKEKIWKEEFNSIQCWQKWCRAPLFLSSQLWLIFFIL